jgi:hypothetical protein
MSAYYRVSIPKNNQDIHNALGALIIIGMMILLLGILVFQMEFMVLGSGIIMAASLCNVFLLESQTKPNIYETGNQYHVETGSAKEDDDSE